MICPKCKDIEMKVYTGSLGYESLTCPRCNLDVKSEETLHYFNIYTSELRAENKELKEQKHNRNALVRKLREEIRLLKLQQESLVLKNNKLINC